MECPNCHQPLTPRPGLKRCPNCGSELPQQAMDTALFPIRRNDRFGFMNLYGDTVIEPQFYLARNFSEGFAAVKNMNGWGFIDKTGHQLFPTATFSDVADFSDGMSLVKENGQYGYVNNKGKVIFYPQFDKAESFSEGLGLVYIRGLGWGYVDKEGERAIQPGYRNASSFHEGLAAVRERNRYGFINKSGRIVIWQLFNNVCDFYQGQAFVKLREEGRYHVIDRRGLPKLFYHIFGVKEKVHFREGMCLTTKDDLYGYLDLKGTAIKPRFTNAHDFSEGLACVCEEIQYGYIDKTGEFVISPEYTAGGFFSEGLAAVRIGNTNWGYINKEGDLVIPPQYSMAYEFHNGLATVRRNGVLQYINKEGHVISNEACFI